MAVKREVRAIDRDEFDRIWNSITEYWRENGLPEYGGHWFKRSCYSFKTEAIREILDEIRPQKCP